MKPTLLIVDDTASIRQKLKRMLAQDFEIVGEASHGAEAVGMVAKLKPALVLMDVVMPKMSGIEATRQIIGQINPPPKIVMLSGLREDKAVLQALSAGASEYLFKPISRPKLVAVLKNVLGSTS